MDEEAVAVVSRHRLTQPLQRPRRRGVRRDIDMQDATGGMFHHDKDIEQTKCGRDDDAEVARADRLRMIPDKGPPALGRRAPPSSRIQALGKILPYGRGDTRSSSLSKSSLARRSSPRVGFSWAMRRISAWISAG